MGVVQNIDYGSNAYHVLHEVVGYRNCNVQLLSLLGCMFLSSPLQDVSIIISLFIPSGNVTAV